MEHRIIQELDKMCAWINEEIENGQGECILDTQYPLKFCIGNIISSLCKFPQNDHVIISS